ncbi:plastocyanin/azurin family copper-binding protein [Halorarius halobius]|uniref:plastocyanin/azurin family copper-binding protein n=1 Tax=Halorarius halobius TaxID=2962671 RepID=UPI0020CBD5FB|nr:plastocyanin/azurin family copper-binding protein [Halorarius halobius]
MTAEPDSVSRRTFLRGTAVGTAAATGSAAAQEATTHTVDMTDGLVFDPDSIAIAPGDTVVWENVGTVGHSVTAYEDDIPDEAAYFASGGFDGESAARSGYPEGDIPGGESYEHTFEVEGTYEYFCIPHESAGMLGTVEVGTGGGTPAGDGGGRPVPQVPDSALSVVSAATMALLSVLGLVYVFLKYGGDYGLEE